MNQSDQQPEDSSELSHKDISKPSLNGESDLKPDETAPAPHREFTRSPIPGRPRSISAPLAQTLRTVHGLTDQMRAIRTHGLRRSGIQGKQREEIAATPEPEITKPADLDWLTSPLPDAGNQQAFDALSAVNTPLKQQAPEELPIENVPTLNIHLGPDGTSLPEEKQDATDKHRAISNTGAPRSNSATLHLTKEQLAERRAQSSMSGITPTVDEQARTQGLAQLEAEQAPTLELIQMDAEQLPTLELPQAPGNQRPTPLPVSNPDATLLARPSRPSLPGLPEEGGELVVTSPNIDRRRNTRLRAIRRQRQNRRERLFIQKRRQRIGTIIGSTLAALLIILLSTGMGYTYSYYQSQQPKLQSIANEQIEQSTRIYDRNGTLLYTLYKKDGQGGRDGRSTPVSYQYIPGFMQDAMLAAEDPTFWKNPGVDPQGTLRAFQQYLSAGGRFESGGSTLTQQLIKNLSNNRDISWQRKASEAAMAIGLTQDYPKWKILEMYFNTSPFGSQEVGVEAATEDFFGLSPKCDANFNCIPAVAFLDRDLTKCKVTQPKLDESTCAEDPLLGLARASFLAGMPQNPVIFDPIVDPLHIPDALGRQDYVLQQMLADDMSINIALGGQTHIVQAITPAIIQQVEALTKKIQFKPYQDNNLAPHFVYWVIQTLANQLGNYQDLVEGTSVPGLHLLNTGGFNIRTTLDLNLESYVENAVDRHLNQPEYQELQYRTATLSEDNNVHDAAAVVIDAKNGEVLAMNGSAKWDDKTPQGSGETNMATTPRQPASSFKPIAIAAAYQMGWYPGIVAPDFHTYFPTTTDQSQPVSKKNTYDPPDYGGAWNNMNSNILTGISNSFNIPALKSEYYAGVENVYDMATRMGITSIDPTTGKIPSLALGTKEVSLLEMTSAYQTFADQGTHVPYRYILDIWDNYGRNLYHYDPNHPNGTQVMSPQVAYLVTSTIDNSEARHYEFGNDTLLNMSDWTLDDGSSPDVAAKTGTSDNFDDNWTIGYTPDVVVGVWAGNADDSGLINSIGITGAAPIWHSIIEYVSGKCNTDSDSIPCPQLDFQYGDRKFPVPPNIVQQQVNTYNGLAGYGFNSFMIDGEQPQSSGSYHK